MMKSITALFIAAVLAGCIKSESIVLRHPVTGKMTTCDGYAGLGLQATMGETRQRNCVADFQRQGYERVPQ